jgi:hypothetical protein
VLHGPYHSVLGDREKCRKTYKEFVVFASDQVYPEFIVTYKRCSAFEAGKPHIDDSFLERTGLDIDPF